MEPRTFKIEAPHMTGTDIRAWQVTLLDRFAAWHIDYPLATDGDYGAATRSATATFMRAWGVASAQEAMEDGLTAWWRTKLREDRRTPEEAATFGSDARVEYRRALRRRHAPERGQVVYPVPNLIDDAWGYHPPVHDGVDLICPANQRLLAICDGVVVRADAGGWWGKGAPADPVLKAKGDGIVIVQSTVAVGPFRPGMNFCYGHAEGAVVRRGQHVKAGQHIGHAGFANAWHVHFMVNDDPPADNLYRGVGDRDPMPFLDYAEEATR